LSNTVCQKPNVLWIGVDSIRYDALACNGNTVCQTPNLDRLAARGVSFDRAYCPVSICSPARTSMMTGKHAFTHGIITNCDMYHNPVSELPDPDMLLHTRIQKLGYRCGWIGKWHLETKKGPADYGFEGMNVLKNANFHQSPEFQAYLAENDLSYDITEPVYFDVDQKALLAGVWNGPVESTPAHYLTNRAIEQMEAFAGSDAPFFLTCQFWGPHQPYVPSIEYAGYHDRNAIEPWINFEDDWAGKPASVRRTHEDFYRALPKDWEPVLEGSPAGWRGVVGSYYDYIRMYDAEIGRMLDRLEALGLDKNTVIVFTSDHGDMTGSHGGMNDKGYMYEEAHRVPLIIAHAGSSPAASRSDELVYNMDIFPTLLDMLGIGDDSLDGRSLLPNLRGEKLAQSREEIFLEFHGIRFLYSQRAVVTRDGWKYIFTPGDQDEVYNLNEDPGELVNLLGIAEHADKIEELRDRMMRCAIATDDPLERGISKFFGHWRPPGERSEPSMF